MIELPKESVCEANEGVCVWSNRMSLCLERPNESVCEAYE